MCVSLSGTWFLHAQRISLQKFSAISSWDTRPLRRCYHPAAIFQQSRAKVGPNSYARGDYVRPCCARQRSLKREPLCNGKTNRIPEKVFSLHGGYRHGLSSNYLPHTQEIPQSASLRTAGHRSFFRTWKIPRCRTSLRVAAMCFPQTQDAAWRAVSILPTWSFFPCTKERRNNSAADKTTIQTAHAAPSPLHVGMGLSFFQQRIRVDVPVLSCLRAAFPARPGHGPRLPGQHPRERPRPVRTDPAAPLAARRTAFVL